MAIWPLSLPQEPVANTVRFGPSPDTVKRTPMSVGSKKRRRTTGGRRPVTMEFAPLTETQRDTFLAFFHDTLADGVLEFDMPDPVTGNVRSWKFGEPGSEYSMGPQGQSRNHYRVSVSLELLP